MTDTADTTATHANPDQGGSYQRDPDTGALTLLHRTEPAAQTSAPDTPAAPATPTAE